MTATKRTLLLASMAMLAALAPGIAAGQGIDGDAQTRDALKEVFGDFKLNADSVSLEGPPDGSVTSMVIRGNVNIQAQLLTLRCDEVSIDMATQKLIAKGELVKFSKQGVEGTCGIFTYDINEKRAVMEGSPKPVVSQPGPDGQSMQTSSADRIFIIQTDEMMNVYMDGGVEMEVKSGATPPVEKPIGTPPPAKVDNKNVGAILRKPPPPKGG